MTSATEDGQGRDGLVTDRHVYFAAGTDVAATDRFNLGGTIYEVDGQPNHAHTPRGEHHLEVRLRAVEG